MPRFPTSLNAIVAAFALWEFAASRVAAINPGVRLQPIPRLGALDPEISSPQAHKYLMHLRLLGNEPIATGLHNDVQIKQKDPFLNRSIWNVDINKTKNKGWVNFTFWHPSGVVSNVWENQVVWADVGYLNIGQVIQLSLLAYPGSLLPLALIGAVVVGHSLKQTNVVLNGPSPSGPPVAHPSELTASSQIIYNHWCVFCCMLPSILVFGVPLLLMYISYFWPQEVFTITLIISSAFVFMNGMYMVFFVPFVLKKMQCNMNKSPIETLGNMLADEQLPVTHWIIFPNFKEDADILAAAIGSVAKSTLAKAQIGVVLAMEEREATEGQDKAKLLSTMLADKFREFAITFHPANLPNDPPGKASNVAYAFKWLAQHVSDSGHDPSKVLITVADADSEFHTNYFELLTRTYMDTEPNRRNDILWQSSVLHMKNYHRQPGPVIVGTMFTAMQEIAYMADPNAIRFPYSTYTLTLSLANEVGGWDAEWIAEDWHMGIKCFLMTLGRTTVQPVFLPTINYSPEEDTWLGTIIARFAQAKRHALGFSDLAYYFMMLPLIFVRVSSGRHATATLADFWNLLFKGLPYLIRFVNVHVLLGIMVIYVILDATLKNAMVFYLDHSISGLFERTFFSTSMFAVSSFTLTFIVTLSYQALYRIVRGNLEKPTSAWYAWMFDNIVAHTLMTAACFIICGPFYFIGLAYAVWVAAQKLLFTRTFVYEVASKPTKESRLAGEALMSNGACW